MDDSYIFCNYEVIFPQRLRHIQHTVANAEQDAVYRGCETPCFDFGAHQENFVSVHCHLQNGVHLVHPLQGQTGGSRRVPDLGCEQNGEERII
jgi:hypothetical protein